MVEVHNSSIFFKNNIPIRMVLFNDIDEKTCQNSLRDLNQIYTKEGNVSRGKNLGGEEMVMSGWRYIVETDDFGEYSHSDKSKEIANEYCKESLSGMGATWTNMISKELDLQFHSFIHDLEALHPHSIPDFWCRVGNSPYSMIDITKNYYSSPHTDSKDTKHSFILWFKTIEPGRGGEFIFPKWNLFIKPSQGTILLFDATKIWHYTKENY